MTLLLDRSTQLQVYRRAITSALAAGVWFMATALCFLDETVLEPRIS